MTSRSGSARDFTLEIELAQPKLGHVVLDPAVLAAHLAGDVKARQGQQVAALLPLVELAVEPVAVQNN